MERFSYRPIHASLSYSNLLTLFQKRIELEWQNACIFNAWDCAKILPTTVSLETTCTCITGPLYHTMMYMYLRMYTYMYPWSFTFRNELIYFLPPNAFYLQVSERFSKYPCWQLWIIFLSKMLKCQRKSLAMTHMRVYVLNSDQS